MAYQRKTRDVWHIYVNYWFGDGWEHETTELDRRAAKENLKAYRENCSYPVKMKRTRERIEEDSASCK